MLSIADTTESTVSVNHLITRAKEAVKRRDWDEAYRLSKQATRLDPDEPEGWLLRFRTSRKEEDQLFCLSKACQLAPDNPKVIDWMNKTMWRELERDPFLAYMDETDQMYLVQNKKYISLAVPKARSVPETYPPQQSSSLAAANRWLTWAVLGLPLAGIGTLLFAPVAAFQAWRVISSPVPHTERVRALMIVLIALAISIPALFLAWLLVIHIV